MGSKWFTGGVVAATHGRIQFDFMFEGVRYRPSIRRPPSEENLRRARERLDEIKRQIRAGTFSFAEEFPDYRFLRRLNGTVKVRSCNDVFDEFLAHCEARLARQDLAAATLSSYRRVLLVCGVPCSESLFSTKCDTPGSSRLRIASLGARKPTTTRSASFVVRSSSVTVTILSNTTRRAVFEARV